MASEAQAKRNKQPINQACIEDGEPLLLSVGYDETATEDATDGGWRAFYSAVVTLSLGVLGSTILPLPYAFSKVGVAVGILTMAVVAVANDATCSMMVRAAAYTGLHSYEALAEWAGGASFKVITQASLILLLFGTLCGGLAFLSDVGRILVLRGLEPGTAPQLLMDDGRPLMVVVAVLVLYPLCLLRRIRQIEAAATIGIFVVLALIGVIVYQSAAAGFPAIYDGELQLFSLKVDEQLPEAFAVFGFAFYMQPMVLPLFKEMPAGPQGVVTTERAISVCLYGVACTVYGLVGIFGAALFGQDTQGNIMVNDLLHNRTAVLVLYFLLLYLCSGMVTTHFALRASLDILLFGPDTPYSWWRSWAETTGGLTAALAVALLYPTRAEKIFALTGCTGVCLVCYVIPVVVHRRLVFIANQQEVLSQRVQAAEASRRSAAAAAGRLGAVSEDASNARGAGPAVSFAADLNEPLLESPFTACANRPFSMVGHSFVQKNQLGAGRQGLDGVRGCCGSMHRFMVDVGQPLVILAVGIGFSVAGLFIAVRDWGK